MILKWLLKINNAAVVKISLFFFHSHEIQLTRVAMGKSMGRKNQGGIYGQDHYVLKYWILSQKLHFNMNLQIEFHSS